MNNSGRLCIVVPCYQPTTDWAKSFAERYNALQEQLSGLFSHISITLVNDGFVEGRRPEALTAVTALLPELHLVEYEVNRGKGYALRQGVAASDADFFMVTDADFPYTKESMLAIVRHLKAHGGIAAGNRDHTYYTKVPWFRKVLSQLLRWSLRHVLRLEVTDSQCGLKGFDPAGKKIFLETRIDRFLFDIEFLRLARNRVPVAPVSVELRQGVVFSKVGWRILATEGFNFIRLLFSK